MLNKTLATILAALPLLCGALPVTDLGNEKPRVEVNNSGERRQSGTFESAGGRPALMLRWDNAAAKYCEFRLPDHPPALPEFTRAKIRANAFIPAGCTAANLNLRITDKDGEVFQFRQPVSSGPEGWREFVYEIDAASPAADSWGGKVNKKIDFPATFTGFASEFNTDSGAGNIGIGTISIDVLENRRPLAVSLETGNPIHVLTPGSTEPFGLRISNIRAAGTEATLEYELSDAYGKPVGKGTEQLKLAAEEQHFLPLPRPEKYGVYYVDLRCRESDSGIEPVEKRLSYCYMAPAGPTPGFGSGFLFGICSHPQRHSLRDQELEALAAAQCGAKVVREDVEWGRMQPAPDRWAFESFDNTVAIFAKYGIEIQAIYSYLPDWAIAKEWKPFSTTQRGNARPDYGDWAGFIRTFADRYKNKVRYVEIWNEPDLIGFANFSPEEYLKMMDIAYRETKKAAPEMTVLTGGFAGTGFSDVPGKAIANRNSYDVIAFHAHGSLSNFKDELDRLDAIVSKTGVTAPWYANETAISSLNIGEMAQATTLFQKFLYSWAHGSIGYNWYDLRNDGNDARDNEHNFGLITNDFHPKAAYGVYNTLATLFTDGKFLGNAGFERGVTGYLFRGKSGGLLLPHWNEDLAEPIRLAVLSGVGEEAELVDLFGNAEKRKAENGQLILEIGRTPATLRLGAQSEPPQVSGELLRLRDEFLLPPGGKHAFRFELFNPTDRPLVMQLDFRLPEGLKAENPRRTVTLAPGKSEILTLELAVDRNFRSFHGQLREIRLDLTAGKLWKGALNYPVRSIAVLSGDGLSEQPEFTIDKAEQATFLTPNDPAKAHLFWQGPEDLSAQIRLGRDRDNLLLEIEVADDVHCQPHRGIESWKGDNIQFAIKLPEQNTFWEIGLTRLADGAPEAFVWSAPEGFNPEKTAKAVKLETGRDEKAKLTTYSAKIPFSAIGLTEAVGNSGFRFNLLVNDNDGEMRETFLSIAPGIGESKTPESYPVVMFAK